MADNTTPLNAMEYDTKISQTIPYYTEFHKQTIDVVKNMDYKRIDWLDTGCGTGMLTFKAAREFHNARFLLADPSAEMIFQAKKNMKEIAADFLVAGSQELNFNNEFTVITAIQAHHYLQKHDRITAIQKIYKALKPGGIFIGFENVIPDTECVKALELTRWGKYQIRQGKTEKEAAIHKARCGVDYFPLTIKEHIDLLNNTQFKYVNVFWLSYMQMGIFGIK
jgi:tRNA (cmo5U34)-methyltransferase